MASLIVRIESGFVEDRLSCLSSY